MDKTIEQQARELLYEVCQELHGVGCGPCVGSDAPMEDLHGRIAVFLGRKPHKHCRHCDGSGNADLGGECPCVVYTKLTRPAPTEAEVEAAAKRMVQAEGWHDWKTMVEQMKSLYLRMARAALGVSDG